MISLSRIRKLLREGNYEKLLFDINSIDLSSLSVMPETIRFLENSKAKLVEEIECILKRNADRKAYRQKLENSKDKLFNDKERAKPVGTLGLEVISQGLSSIKKIEDSAKNELNRSILNSVEKFLDDSMYDISSTNTTIKKRSRSSISKKGRETLKEEKLNPRDAKILEIAAKRKLTLSDNAIAVYIQEHWADLGLKDFNSEPLRVRTIREILAKHK